ncbi:sigma-54 interacting transcriptional regulator [Neolewinella xylanilytica]|uniref:Sigma-54 interacting transcriptional regulator n=1 Tax=Neolewinella xylanilytica TaxID=1514080 RepID=A0A2S6I3T0_9BACT|nr:sigma-54 dependent transcriptional regulator [Neolewinella xylanilytica]PPK85836.1 sigma-54 interacting transcriptional regulator [Neolewinella xylanilytica]
MLSVAGQPDLVEMDRTVFGLGIFHNPAEFRGFLLSFKQGGATRRLVLPVGRFSNTRKPLILFATRITYANSPAICGIISRTRIDGEAAKYIPEEDAEVVIDKLNCFAMRIDEQGNVLSINLPLLIELGLDRTQPLPALTEIDAEQNAQDIASHLRSAMTRGSVTYQTSFQRNNNTLIPVEVTIKPLSKIAYKDQYMITAFDLTGRRAEERQRQTLEIELEKLSTQLERRSALMNDKLSGQISYKIVSQSPLYDKVLQQINQVAATDSTVLITGETGTGKELIARAIHALSLRARRPLVILNCGALPADLIESELFGYRKGAFTGARGDHLGRFELADEGTLFLDEIGEMPMLLQTRLLRVLQDGEFTPLGAKESIQTDVRIIAATNRNLRERVSEGSFRSDLYFRLNVFPIHSPALRERPEDIPALVAHFIKKHGPKNGRSFRVRQEDIDRLQAYPFDGNVRELENIIQRALIVSDGEYLDISLDRAPKAAMQPLGANTVLTEADVITFEEMQRRHILSVLHLTEGKVSGKDGAAKLLGLNPQTLFSKMRKLGINRPSGRTSGQSPK